MQNPNWFRLFTYRGSIFNINKHGLNSKVIAYNHFYCIVCTAALLFKNALKMHIISISTFFFFSYFPDLCDLWGLPLLATNQLQDTCKKALKILP